MVMHWFRKVLVAFFALILFISFINIAWSVAIVRNLGNPATVKAWIASSKIYDNAVSAVLNNTQNDEDKNGGDSSISLKDPVVQQAAKEAFSPALLQSSVNTFIDSNYAWLNGKTATPDFNIDLSKAKEDFATKVGTAVKTRLAGLKVCTAEQQAALQIPVTVTTVTCRPANLDPATEGARVANEIRTSEFLSNPVLTADTLAHDKNNTSSKPYYQQVAHLPEAFQAAKVAPYALSLLALICILAIVFIASPSRKGWRRVASVLLVAGVLLIGAKFIGDYSANRIENQLGKSKTVVSQLRGPSSSFIDRVESDITQTNLYFGIGYIVLALIIYGVLLKTKDGSGKSRSKKSAAAPKVPATPAPAPQAPRTAPTDVTGAGEKPTGPPVFKTPKPTPVRKNPKPPRLIQ